MMFDDRADAGRQLAAKLSSWRRPDTVVLGLPRGGVVTAREVARFLEAPLDIRVARKIGAPWQPEFAIGAVTARGTRVLNQEALRMLLLPPGYLDRATAAQQAEAQDRERRLRDGRPALPLAGKTVILVDDGVATGMTMLAAIRDVRADGPARIIVAAPVIAPPTVPELANEADAVVAVATPEPFMAVGMFYASFSQTTDDEVRAILSSATASSRG